MVSRRPASKEGEITEEQALAAIKEYCFTNNPGLEGMEDSDEYTSYWDVSTNENGEIVVLYRSYTGAQIRYYIDPESGETYVTELVPGIIDEEQRTEVRFDQGVRLALDYILSHPEECQKEDPEFDAWCDMVIEVLEEAKTKVKL